MLKEKIQKNKGFVILFSMLVSSLILLISAGIFNVVQKEVVLSSSARESQRAFYAADSALECALYADIVGVRLDGPNTTLRTPFPVNPNANEDHNGSEEEKKEYQCGGQPINSRYLLGAGGTVSYEIPYFFTHGNSFNSNDQSCAYVLVEKELKGNSESDDPVTEVRITAVGYNVCDEDDNPDLNDPTLLERRLSLSYTQQLPIPETP
jgi:hypothetical protein